MQLQNIYRSDINRNINGVIKVAQDNEDSIEQELKEYVITRELRRHFNTFFNMYERSLTEPTDKIGVWISGFFGSGKSHFLKVLSYLLSNRIVKGKHAVEYFADKFDDPFMFAQLERCVGVPTDTILFNIDSKSPINKDKTAILRVFAKVFYEYRGFYGDDLKIARLEQFIEKSGKTAAFRTRFEEIHGDSWENSRDAFSFFEDDVVSTMTDVLEISETAARNWFNGIETADLSIEQLVREIKEYLDTKEGDFRLLFMVDEVGQYIGSDSDLMLNLQTIVEEIGSRCEGRVWVMVTSQEAIDTITKISGNDFSKIQGRFNTRLSLSSSSVDEVIKKRILAKTDDAASLLAMNYEKNSAVLRNLFTFTGAVLDIKGYSGEVEFVETYPFVPYQFRLMQNVLAEIRKHGNSGKHLSGGERSMLSGFQEAAQELNDKDENALVPFCLFYKTVHTFLESTIRRVIDRCQRAAESGDGLEPYDVDVLKLLYLIRYIADVKANPETITTLMIDDIRADKIEMRKRIMASLDRLVRQNYVARNGDIYTFLTDEEQEIEKEIRERTDIDEAAIVDAVGRAIFGTIYDCKRFRYGDYDFPLEQIIDDTSVNQPGSGMRLRILTIGSDWYQSSEQVFKERSSLKNEAILVLSDRYSYWEELVTAAKIRKFVRSRNFAQQPEAVQLILRNKQEQAGAYEKTAVEHLSSAIMEARAFVCGDAVVLRGSTVRERVNCALSRLVENVYTKLGYIRQFYNKDDDILAILHPAKQQFTVEGDLEVVNPEAAEEIERYLEMQGARTLTTSMGDIQRRFSAVPYGWREIDIAATVASLVAARKLEIRYAGATIPADDRRMPDYLRRRTEVDRVTVRHKVAIDPLLLRQSCDFLREYFNIMDLPAGEDDLVATAIEKFDNERIHWQELLQKQYSMKPYPGRETVKTGVSLLTDLMAQRRDHTAFLRKMLEMRNPLLDFEEEASEITAFFQGQKETFDRASTLLNALDGEMGEFRDEETALPALEQIRAILSMEKPYRRIPELPGFMDKVRRVYDDLLKIRRQEVLGQLAAVMDEIYQAAGPDPNEIISCAKTEIVAKQTAIEQATTLTSLDAMKIQISNIRHNYMSRLVAAESKGTNVCTVERVSICRTKRLATPADVDQYVSDIRERLLQMLDGHDEVHVI